MLSHLYVLQHRVLRSAGVSWVCWGLVRQLFTLLSQLLWRPLACVCCSTCTSGQVPNEWQQLDIGESACVVVIPREGPNTAGISVTALLFMQYFKKTWPCLVAWHMLRYCTCQRCFCLSQACVLLCIWQLNVVLVQLLLLIGLPQARELFRVVSMATMATRNGTLYSVDVTESRRKVASAGGKIRVGCNDTNHSAKSYHWWLDGNSKALHSVPDSQFLASDKYTPQHFRGKKTFRGGQCVLHLCCNLVFSYRFRRLSQLNFRE